MDDPQEAYTAHAKKQARPPLTKILLGGAGAGKSTFIKKVLAREMPLADMVVADFNQLRYEFNHNARSPKDLSRVEFSKLVAMQCDILQDVFDNDYDIVFETSEYDYMIMNRHMVHPYRRLEVDILLCDPTVAWERYSYREYQRDLIPDWRHFNATHREVQRAIDEYRGPAHLLRVYDTSLKDPVLKLTHSQTMVDGYREETAVPWS